MASSAAEQKTYTGGCHCGFIRYSIQADLTTSPSATKCNCSLCLKLNLMVLRVPRSQFTLEKPGSKEDPGIGDYSHGPKRFHFYFCKNCSIMCFMEGSYVDPQSGKEVDTFGLSAVTLDPVEGLDLRKFKVSHWDGKNDNWTGGMKDEPWPGGV